MRSMILILLLLKVDYIKDIDHNAMGQFKIVEVCQSELIYQTTYYLL